MQETEKQSRARSRRYSKLFTKVRNIMLKQLEDKELPPTEVAKVKYRLGQIEQDICFEIENYFLGETEE